jgi:flagellar biogenesis protein FliO
MDALSIAGAAVCMIGMCVVGMWLMMRFMHRDRDGNH